MKRENKFPKTIYTLVHNGKVVYVGQTQLELNKRFYVGYKHIPDEILKECEIVGVDIVNDKTEMIKEREWIEKYGLENLYNKYKGNGVDKKEAQREYQRENYERLYNEYYKDYWHNWKIINREKYNEYMREYMKNKRQSNGKGK